MNTDDFATLLAILGYCTYLAPKDSKVRQEIDDFIIRLNRTNPDYDLYLAKGDTWAQTKLGDS